MHKEIYKWIKKGWLAYLDLGNELGAQNAINAAKLSLSAQGLNENSPGYVQKLIEESIRYEELQDSLSEDAMFASGGLKVLSLIKNETSLIKAAEKMGKDQAIQEEANDLIVKFLNGNTNPGLGSKNLFNDICYLRGSNGARVFYRMTDNGMEILAKASKANEEVVIKILQKIYG